MNYCCSRADADNCFFALIALGFSYPIAYWRVFDNHDINKPYWL